MGLSFTLRPEEIKSSTSTPPEKRAVLVTGAAGRIGSYFAKFAAGRYSLKLMVRDLDDRAEELRDLGEIVEGDIADVAGLKKRFQGVDTVLHLAGDPDPNAVWDDLLAANIQGTYNVFLAAKAAGCRRVIFASSIHAVSGYAKDVQVRTSEPVNPGDLYGVTKCFGEALGRYFAEKENLSVIAVRIGAFQPLEVARKETGLGMMDCFVSQRDLSDLLVKCVDNVSLQFAILHGVSDNRFKRLDVSDARELVGYAPQDDFTETNKALEPLHLSQRVRACSLEDPEQKSGLREDLKAAGMRSGENRDSQV